MTKEHWLDNYIRTSETTKPIFGEVSGGKDSAKMMFSILGTLYDQLQMIEYLDDRVIELERIIYSTEKDK